MSDSDNHVMNLAQMARIESVHRGFLYQHLYAVGCLLRLASQSSGIVAVERDEDVEIVIGDEILFIQVKTRTGPLIPSDISSTLLRFDELRLHYAKKYPDNSVRFVVLSNVEPGLKLSKDIKNTKWPSDVFVISPALEGTIHEVAPPAWSSISEAISWCIEAAEALPFLTLSPETLVWKLAARVQYASSGHDAERKDHIFSRSDLPVLFEQLVEQLQGFPDAPSDYRVLQSEPPLVSSDRTRLIVGFSGAGKTSWAAFQAKHCSASTAYFDVGDLPSKALASSLARELAARFISGSGQGAAQIPASTGIEFLKALNNHLDLEEPPVVVVDNIQRIAPDGIRQIVDACPDIHFVLLAQPWEDQGRLEALLGISAENIQGWDSHTVAAVFSDEGAIISPRVASLCTSLTGGLPLYVKSAAALCVKQYACDAEAFVNEIDNGEHIVEIAQEAILRQTVASLLDNEAHIVAALSLVTIRLSGKEIHSYLDALPSPLKRLSSKLRSLQRKGLIQVFVNGDLKMHDALRLSASELLENFTDNQIRDLQVRLRDVLMTSLLKERDLSRLSAWLQLLGPTGQAETLVDLATTEFFHEIGEPSDLKAVLIATSDDENISPSLRFWTLDALAFWEIQDDQHTRDPSPFIERMEELLKTESLGNREHLALIMKQMNFAGIQKRPKELNAAFQKAKPYISDDPELSRIVRYNYASAFYQCDKYRDALTLSEALYAEYYDVLDLDVAQVIGANREGLIRLLDGRHDDNQDNIKHLADSLNLAAMCKRAVGEHPRMTAIHAAKFYQLSGAHRSEMKAAQDVADDFISCGDVLGARQVMENYVLPVLRYFGFEASTMDAHGQYAIILAYSGEYASARAEMAPLQAYVTDLPPEYQASFSRQCSMIDEIEAGVIMLPQNSNNVPPHNISQSLRRKVKVGRNALCPCGSGKKYKKCCLV